VQRKSRARPLKGARAAGLRTGRSADPYGGHYGPLRWALRTNGAYVHGGPKLRLRPVALDALGDTLVKFEIITNALDLAAFAMVTVDLYGRERLEALSERLRSTRNSPKRLFFLSKRTRLWALATVVYAIDVVMEMTYNQTYKFKPVELVVTGIFLFLLFWALPVMLPRIIKYLFVTFKLEGLLVVWGSLIFFISRIVAISAAISTAPTPTPYCVCSHASPPGAAAPQAR